jgi:RNA polymerase sigma factor FliA
MITVRHDTAAKAKAGTAHVTTIDAPSPAPLRLVRRTVRENRVRVKPLSTTVTLHSSHPRPSVTADAKLALRDKVVLEHLPLVKAIAVRVHQNLPVHVDLDDLVHAGILGLLDAANKYDPEKRVAFSAYAKHRIKGAILDSLRQLDWASREIRCRHKQVEAATRDLYAELQRNPTEGEMAQRLGVGIERLRTMMTDLRNVGLVSASTRGKEDDDLPLPDFPSKPDTRPDFIYVREELCSALRDAMKTLSARYQKVILLYYTKELKMKEIGGVLGINESRVSQIHKSALEKMAIVLHCNGIDSIRAFQN